MTYKAEEAMGPEALGLKIAYKKDRLYIIIIILKKFKKKREREKSGFFGKI